MNLHSLTKTLSAAVLTLVTAASTQAAVISINFAGDDQGQPYQYTVSGNAGVVSAGYWNNYYNAGGIGGNGLHFNLLTDSGEGAGAGMYINYTGTASPNAPGAVWGLGTLAGNISNPNAGIFNNYLNYFANGGAIYFNNLGEDFTSNGYNVIVYFSNPYSSSLYLNLNDGTQNHQLWASVVAGQPFSGFTQSTGTTLETATVANYVTFTGLTSGGFSLSGGGTSADPAIAAIQIVAVPEPGTTAMIVCAAGMGMLFLRRRRNA